MNQKHVASLDSVTSSRLISVGSGILLSEVAKMLSGTQTSLAVVCNVHGTMVGVITKTDIVQWIGHCSGHICSVCASDVMTSEVIYCHPRDGLQEVLSVMQKKGVIHLPIVDEKHKPLGVLNMRDALKVLYFDEKYEDALLRDYVMGVGYH